MEYVFSIILKQNNMFYFFILKDYKNPLNLNFEFKY